MTKVKCYVSVQVTYLLDYLISMIPNIYLDGGMCKPQANTTLRLTIISN